jgi:hypothetical protein
VDATAICSASRSRSPWGAGRSRPASEPLTRGGRVDFPDNGMARTTLPTAH